MNDATRRAIRSFIQIGIVEGTLRLLEAFDVPLTGNQHQAIILFCTPFLALLQNLLEDKTSFPALLKAPPSGGVNPVPDDAGPSS